jgi:hypothetical protein
MIAALAPIASTAVASGHRDLVAQRGAADDGSKLEPAAESVDAVREAA